MKRILVVVVVMSLSACGMFSSKLTPPDVSLAGLRLGQGDGLYQTVLVDLVLTNPNTSALKLNAISYHVRVAGRDLVSGTSSEPLLVPAGGSAHYTVPATVSLINSFGLIRDVLMKPGDKVAYELTATLEPSGLFSIPITVRKADTVDLAR